MTQGPSFKRHCNYAWVQVSPFCSLRCSSLAYAKFIAKASCEICTGVTVASSLQKRQWLSWRSGHTAQRRGEKWRTGWVSHLREELEVLCLQGAQHVLREIIYWGNTGFSWAAQNLTVEVGSLCGREKPSHQNCSSKPRALPLVMSMKAFTNRFIMETLIKP